MTHAVTRALCHRLFVLVLGLCAALAAAAAEAPAPKFHVVAFYDGKVEEAHLSFVREANRWFGETARQDGFSYEATTDWTRLEPGVPLTLPGRAVPRRAARGTAPSARPSGSTWRRAAAGWGSTSRASR